MRETGKIYVVVGVILLIFLGIVLYLVRLDRKLTKLESQLNEEKNEQPH
ncbi:MAG: CcmD family protein [Saprospiraceae bacterium]